MSIADSLIVVKKGATLQLVARQFTFTEGPAVDKQGCIFFTDQPNNQIWKYDTDGKLSLFMDSTGRSNGLYFNSKGNIVACADKKNELWEITPKKKVTVLFTNYKGDRVNGPNDLWIDASDGIYFTDPYYQRDYWARKEPAIKGEKVYYLPHGKHEATIVAENVVKPNGILGSADGKFLFVSDIGDNKVYKYAINTDGSLTDQQIFVEQGGDGITLDNQGNLYVAGKGVTVFDKNGNKLGNIPVPEDWTANLCFGGKNRDVLFITASKGVYTLQMNVKGIE